MPTANLFLVTGTLQRLLDLNVRALLSRDGLPPNVDVTTMPPEQAKGRAISLGQTALANHVSCCP